MSIESSAPASLEPNASMTVEERTVVAINGQPAKMPVRAVLRLARSPRLVLEYDAFPPKLLCKTGTGATLLLDNGGKVEVVRPWPLPGPAGLRGVLHPRKQPFTVFDRGDPLQAVSFSVINFLNLHGNRDAFVERDGKSILCGRAELETPSFRATLTANHDLSRNEQLLAANGGYAITHGGRLVRRDGDVFARAEAERVLIALRRFLSFARGTSCALVQAKGRTANGDCSWQCWGSHGVAEWNPTPSWSRGVTEGMDALADAFPGFWRQFEDDEAGSDSSVEFAIEWYVSSNESNAVAPGLVLSQAALERLTHKSIGPKRKNGKKQEKTGIWIGRALGEAHISETIPTELQHLVALPKERGWSTGPHAIVAARNDLVHPRMVSPVSTEALIEARRLSQWYVELLLLKLFDYSGSYRNRIKNEWEPVPWAVST